MPRRRTFCFSPPHSFLLCLPATLYFYPGLALYFSLYDVDARQQKLPPWFHRRIIPASTHNGHAPILTSTNTREQHINRCNNSLVLQTVYRQKPRERDALDSSFSKRINSALCHYSMTSSFFFILSKIRLLKITTRTNFVFFYSSRVEIMKTFLCDRHIFEES